MGTVQVSEAYANYLLEQAKDPFLDGVIITIFTRPISSMATETLTSLAGAVCKLAVHNHGIKEALRLLMANGVKDIDDIMENQLYHTLKQCLHYIGWDLVSKQNHQFAVCGRPYLWH